MRYIVISDIHGHYKELMMLLQKANYDQQKDFLLFLGDYVDRGMQSKEVVQFIKEKVQNKQAVALRGNHDQNFLDWLHRKNPTYEGKETIESFLKGGKHPGPHTYILTTYQRDIEFLESLPLFYETENYVFVHAGIDPTKNNWKETSVEDFLTIRIEFYGKEINIGKKVIFGHTPCKMLHGKHNILIEDNLIGIDGGIAYGYQLNALLINENQSFETIFVQKGEHHLKD